MQNFLLVFRNIWLIPITTHHWSYFLRNFQEPKFWCQVPNEYAISYKEALKIIIPFHIHTCVRWDFNCVRWDWVWDEILLHLWKANIETVWMQRFMRLALSDVEPRFQKLVEAKWRWTLLSMSSGISCCLNLVYVCSNLLGSQLFLQIEFLKDVGSQRKMVEKRCSRWICMSQRLRLLACCLVLA